MATASESAMTTRRQRGIARPWAFLLLVAWAVLAFAAVPPALAAPTQFRLNGDVHVAAEQTLDSAVTLNGTITVEGVVLSSAFTANGDIRVLPGGRIEGDAVSLTGRVLVEEGGSVLGETVEFGGDGIQVSGTGPSAVARNVGVDSGSGVGWFFFVLGAMGLGLLLVLIASGGLKSVGRELTARTGRSALVGLLASMGVPVLFVILLISVVGIPVALLLIPLVPLTAMFGIYALALLTGQRLLETVGREKAGDAWAMLAGVALLGVATLIPVLGVLVWVVAGFFGFGATLTRLWEHYQDRRALRAAGRQGPAQPPWQGEPAPHPQEPGGSGPAQGAAPPAYAAPALEATGDAPGETPPVPAEAAPQPTPTAPGPGVPSGPATGEPVPPASSVPGNEGGTDVGGPDVEPAPPRAPNADLPPGEADETGERPSPARDEGPRFHI